MTYYAKNRRNYMFKPRPIRGANGYDTKEASDMACPSADPQFWGPSQTIQSQADDANINILMERFGITGKMPENVHIPMYGDFTQITDYKGALEAVRFAHDKFMEIPAQIRNKFDNDPQKYLEYTANPANLAEMRTLGIAKPLPPQPQVPPNDTTGTGPSNQTTTGNPPAAT
jgi:phage internal scaffolding protein